MKLSLRFAALPLAALAIASLAGCPDKDKVPEPKEKTFPDAVSAFFTGTISLEAADKKAAGPALEAAAKLAPGEPAVHANLALLSIPADLPAAQIHLKRALELAPDNEKILAIAGALADAEGKFDVAIDFYKKAAEKNPRSLRTLYKIADLVERQSLPDAEKQRLVLFEKILDADPRNLAAQTERLISLAKLRDTNTSTFDSAFATLAERRPSLAPAAQTMLDTIKAAPIARRVALLRAFQNAAKSGVDYQRDLDRISFVGDRFGEPLLTPLTLKVPPPSPAAPDTALTFTMETGETAGFALAAPLAPEENSSVFHVAAGQLVAPNATLPVGAGATAIAFDYDRDFISDLASVGPGGLKLFRHAGASVADKTQYPWKFSGGKLTDSTAATRLPPAVTNRPYSRAFPVDLEADGDLDLILTPASGPPVVLQNNGNATFSPIASPFVGLTAPRALSWADSDGDGDPDALFLDSAGKLSAFDNERSGLFVAAKSPAPSLKSPGVALATIEISGDTNLDTVALSEDGALTGVFRDDTGAFQSLEIGKATVAKPRAILAGDLDNNGAVDLIVSGETQTQIFLRGEKGEFTALSATVAMRADSIADVDGDGFLDLAGVSGGKQALAKTKSARGYKSLNLTLVAKPDPSNASDKINSFGIGGELEARIALLYQKVPLTGPQAHLGLGTASRADIVRITWPTGNAQSEVETKSGRVYADQRLGGSCPFLFAWNGREFVFVTDCIWRSPLGLKINAQNTAGVNQTEDWVKIRGDQLVAKDGFYDLRVTAELRETHFFDHLSLMTVDHPDGTEIFIDERFSPAAPPKLAIIPTKTPRAVASARGAFGQDVGDVLAERDGVHLDDFGRGTYQGVAKTHFVEVELPGDAPKNAPLYLIASGWIHPTDTSVNVAMGQNPSQGPPKGVSLWTPNARGEWKETRPNLGFPEGKVKTVVLRIDDLFASGAARKVRIQTNLEIFWDQIRFAEALPTAPKVVTKLAATTADLRYRGFSYVVAKDSSSPELPENYANLAGSAPRWRDLEGWHTRFGDIRPLLFGIDDRYVIMNAGDELALRFAAPPAPKPGWKRDFVLVGDGWVKDGNVNTAFGKTVYPYPTHAQKSYTTPFSGLQNDPGYRAHPGDWDEYHTRFVTSRRFAEALFPTAR